eukprot:CAMPEP_0175031552 /NCGR_PEP_ID=MMETSP0005-20121125/20883_1 /TAXON_ID=420556 /ORGANISM="Ochromonas sp., Strain CCMP1393" /LENGTH=218 /DNA_ID=CAMNT_0016291823 /DNA_START=60 /DNA_END=713 /DNA_ORIENTATION=-
MTGTAGPSSDSKSSAAAFSANAPSAVPQWNSSEINARLEENEKLLKEWEELIQRTGSPGSTSISSSDAQRHALLKRKLHDSLGLMARIVQAQIKQKKSSMVSTSAAPAPVGATGTTNAGSSSQSSSRGAVGQQPQQQYGGMNGMNPGNNANMHSNSNNSNLMTTSAPFPVAAAGNGMGAMGYPNQQMSVYNNGYVSNTNTNANANSTTGVNPAGLAQS